jgi:hypothetical protein
MTETRTTFRYATRTPDGRSCCAGNEPNFPRCERCRSNTVVVHDTAPAQTPYGTPPDGYALAVAAAARRTSTTATTPKPGMPPDGYAMALAAIRQEKE